MKWKLNTHSSLLISIQMACEKANKNKRTMKLKVKHGVSLVWKELS